jgi:16S rRNA (uracil1498-N3)-methyltransferase
VPAWFYCPDRPRDGRVRLGPEETRHLARVCRLAAGDRVEIFDGRGTVLHAEVAATGGSCVELTVLGPPLPGREPACSLALATAVPKGERFGWLVEKATELGVDRLIPMITERSVVEPRASRLARLRRSIVEASKQCRRARLMTLEAPMAWTEAVDSFAGSIRLMADPGGCGPARWPVIPARGSVVLAVGPEGGFTDSERATAATQGWLAINLGPHTLRIETAGLAGCAALLARVGETDA